MKNKLTNAYGSTWLQYAQDLVGRKRIRIEIDGYAADEVSATLFVDNKQVCGVYMADGVDAAMSELFKKYEAQTKPAPAGGEAR